MNQKKIGWTNGLLILGIVVLTVVPLLLLRDSEFAGTDREASAVIREVKPNYKPWMNPLIKLPSSEMESLLFVLQGAMGSGMIGFVIGRYKGRSERNQTSKYINKHDSGN